MSPDPKRPIRITFGEALDRYIASRAGKVQAMKRPPEAIVPIRLASGHLRVDQVMPSKWDGYAESRFRKLARRIRLKLRMARRRLTGYRPGDAEKNIPEI